MFLLHLLFFPLDCVICHVTCQNQRLGCRNGCQNHLFYNPFNENVVNLPGDAHDGKFTAESPLPCPPTQNLRVSSYSMLNSSEKHLMVAVSLITVGGQHNTLSKVTLQKPSGWSRCSVAVWLACCALQCSRVMLDL